MQGATYSRLIDEFGISKTCVHNYIEDTRALLREETEDLAARERAVAIELLDNAIEKIVPHINGEIDIRDRDRGQKWTDHNHGGGVAGWRPSLRGPGEVAR